MTVTFHKLYILPLFTCLWICVTLPITNYLAAWYGHALYFMPYISDGGAHPPEMCIFAQMLNTGSVMLAACMYIRYRQIHLYCELYEFNHSVPIGNKVCFWIGIVATFGTCLLANFQESYVFIVHISGALLAFSCASLYIVIQTVLSLMMYPRIGTKCMNALKLLISFTVVIATSVCAVTGLISLILFDGDTILKWKTKHRGYTLHVVSAITEWISVFLFMAYILTFCKEFRAIAMYEPDIELTYEGSQIGA